MLFSGTGMPTLRAIVRAGKELGLPAVSSNLCLTWALHQILGIATAREGAGLLVGWEPGLESL